jgi:hypothetical protein
MKKVAYITRNTVLNNLADLKEGFTYGNIVEEILKIL